MTNKIISALLIISLFIISSTYISYATTPQETLNQYITDLQKNPNDNVLREKIIKHVQTMKTKPTVPEEARRHYVMGVTLINDAKKGQDYNEASEELKKALLIAPWWADAYRYSTIALKAAERYDEAISMLKLYILTNPKDLRNAQDEIYKIEAKSRQAAKDKQDSAEAERIAEQKRKAEREAKAKLESVEGTWHYLSNLGGTLYRQSKYKIQIYRGNGGEWRVDIIGNNDYTYDVRQTGRSISFTRTCRNCDQDLNTDHYSLILSPNGSRLVGTMRTISIEGNNPQWITLEAEYIRDSEPWSGAVMD